jgi:hypothetical protein
MLAGPWTLARLHATVAVVLTAGVTLLYLSTLSGLRRFQPGYPHTIVLSTFTPPDPMTAAHGLYPIAVVPGSLVALFLGFRFSRRNPPARRAQIVLFAVHSLMLGGFLLIFAWAQVWITNASRYVR